MSLQLEMKLSGIDGVLATLQSLPAEVVSKRGGPVKDALRKGARVILLAERANLQAVTSNATSTGRRESTGVLLKNLIATRGKAPRVGKGERYLVRVKRKLYSVTPAGLPRKKKAIISTIAVAQMLEYGSSKQPAEPFIRPAVISRAREAITTIERELISGIDKVVRMLAARDKGK